MALADWFSLKSPLHLEGEGVRLRPFRSTDYREWAELRLRSRDFLQPWEPLWPADDLTYGGFKRRMAAYQREVDLSVGYPFLIFRESDGTMVGGVSLSNVRRGVAMMGTVGYWCGADFTRQRLHPGRGAGRGGLCLPPPGPPSDRGGLCSRKRAFTPAFDESGL